jgi:hypothetical protein
MAGSIIASRNAFVKQSAIVEATVSEAAEATESTNFNCSTKGANCSGVASENVGSWAKQAERPLTTTFCKMCKIGD